MKPYHFAAGLVVASMTIGVSDASAQVIGTFRWRTEPYCNVLTLTVTQNGSAFLLSGFDEPCGGSLRLPVQGVAVPTGDWCIKFSEAIPLERRKAAVVGAGYNGALVANLTGALPGNPCPGGISVIGYAGITGSAQANNAFSFVVP